MWERALTHTAGTINWGRLRMHLAKWTKSFNIFVPFDQLPQGESKEDHPI